MYKTNYNHQKVLTAFDKYNIEKSRRYAVKICIEVTLEVINAIIIKKIKNINLMDRYWYITTNRCIGQIMECF